MQTNAKLVRRSVRAALWCGLTLVCLCAPVCGAGDEQLEKLLATERQALQEILNNPQTDTETKALVREMLDWNARGRTFADFQKSHLPPVAAAQQHSAASAAGDAIFGGHAEASAHAVAAPPPITGGHIPAPSAPRRSNGAGEGGGMPLAAREHILQGTAEGAGLRDAAQARSTGLRDALPLPMPQLSSGPIPAPSALQPVAGAGLRDGMQSATDRQPVVAREHVLGTLAEGAALKDGPASARVVSLARGQELRDSLKDGVANSADAHRAGVPVKQPGVAAWGEPDTFATPRLQPRGEKALAQQTQGAAQSALPAKNEAVAAWVEDAHFGPIKPMQPLQTKSLLQQGETAAGRAMPAKPAVGVWTEASARSMEKKVYTGPPLEAGGKGEFYRQQMEAEQRRSKEQSLISAQQRNLTPMRSMDGDVVHVRDTALTPMTVKPAPAQPGVSVHTPPPKPAAPAAPPKPQIMMVDSFCAKHGKYGGQYKVGEKVECPQCKAEKAQSVAGGKPAAPPTYAHTPPTPPPPKPAAPPKPQIMMVDALCPKHGPYGGQYKVGEKVECPRCKAEKAAAAAANNKPLVGTIGAPDAVKRQDILPPRPSGNMVAVKPAAPPSIAMVDAFCPKHKIKYGGQVHPGEKLECPRCKAEREQNSKPAPVAVQTPPKPAAPPAIAMIDAFCPKHKIKYGGQVRPGEKLECPKCKEEKNKGGTLGPGFIR